MKLRNIPNDLELEIRQEFSHKLKNMIALKRWIEDVFGQIVLHDQEKLYSYKTRVKEISSVLKKLDGKIQNEKDQISTGQLVQDIKWGKAKSFFEVESLIDDWVGCRVITYLHDTLLDLHNQILTRKNRFKLINITIHDSEDHPKFRDLKLKRGRDQRRWNHNGYVGIHYIIEPIADDPCWKNEPLIFPKFELQIRTLLQEAWGQIQHAVIYKGRMPDYIKQERSNAFTSLSGLLSHCDSELGRLAKDPTVKQLVEEPTSHTKRIVRQKSLPLHGKSNSQSLS
jgi:ppGpp synthetase/RelA/SpoT-type nucleotidyltranferase